MTHCKKSERLPIEPFRSWLSEEVERDGIGLVALSCGSTPRQLSRVLRESQGWVGIDLVDRCLLNSPTRLDDLYPMEEL